MNQYWSRRIREAVPYTPGEQPKNRKFIKLNTNECPYPPSPRAAEAIRGAAGGGCGSIQTRSAWICGLPLPAGRGWT